MKRIRVFFLAALLSVAARAQNVLPNVSYNAQLNAACTNANTSCSGAVFASGSSQAGSLGSGSALDVPVANYAAATVTVSGTYAGATINFDFSDPTSGTNYFQEVCARTDINLLEVSEVLPTNQVRAWQCPVWAATRFRVRASAYTSGNVNVWITLTQAAIDPSLVVAASITNIAGASDPCQDVSAIKQSAAINVSSAANQLVALSGTTTVYVCGFTLQTTAGTGATYTFQYGTGTNCATGTTALTGPIAGAVFWNAGFDSTLFKTASGNALCLAIGGTPGSAIGFLTYVQQ